MSNVDFGRYKKIVKYFWDPEPKNDDPSQSPIWCLGREYTARPRSRGGRSKSAQQSPENDSPPRHKEEGSYVTPDKTDRVCMNGGRETSPRRADEEEEGGWPKEFLDDFESKVWFTYRSGFAAIKKSTDPKASASMSLSVRLRSQLDQGGFTSDTGWGCMIRSGQSLLANTLLMLRLGRDWRRGTQADKERKLLSLFADDAKAPFSLQRFVEHGALACGKHPGEWFGPSATARCIQALSEQYPDSGLKVYMNGDGADVYEDTFLKLAKAENGTFTPTLILVGIRLGIDRVTPVYWEALKAVLRLPQSIGIAGGRPSSSHYFIGVQRDNFFYMDPHQTRPALPLHDDLAEYTQDEIDSCHTRRLRRLSINDMDPSMLIAFLITDERDWGSWRGAVSKIKGKPVVHVADTEPILHSQGLERASAVDDVEILDDDDEGDGDLVESP